MKIENLFEDWVASAIGLEAKKAVGVEGIESASSDRANKAVVILRNRCRHEGSRGRVGSVGDFSVLVVRPTS
jgi:hypothetical protein